MQWGQVKDLDFIDNPPTNERGLIFGVVYDYEGDGFALYHPTPEKVEKLYTTPTKTYYLAKHLVDEKYDIYLLLIDKIFLHYSYSEVVDITSKILFSFNNLLASLEKYFLYQELYQQEYGHHISELITNEYNSFFVNLRSFYDLLQVLINKILQKNKKQDFPSSFYKMAIKEKDDLNSKYNYSDDLVYFYKNVLPRLHIIRKIRDDIIHKGIQPSFIYNFEDGFGIEFRNSILNKLEIRSEELMKKNEIGSVLLIFSYFTLNLINDMNYLAEVLPSILEPEPPISENYNYYIRLPYNFHVLRLREYFKTHWYDTPQLADVYVGNPEDMTSKI